MGVRVSHPFGDLVSQHLHRKHGLSQSKLADGILQAPSIITAMCKGRRLTGPQARERVVAIIGWLHAQGALATLDEANALLDVAGMSKLNGWAAAEVKLAQRLRLLPTAPSSRSQIAPKHNLPAPASSLIGRDEDVAAVRTLLQRDGIRLVSLLGPPGVGKTRLAIESARAVCANFSDGVWFVALAPVNDPDLATVAIAQALGVTLPASAVDESIRQHLRDKHLLLVLDNFEQLVTAAPLVAGILASAPQVKILATSRATLHITGEHKFEVKPLAVPSKPRPAQVNRAMERSPDEIAGYPSVELFVQRTRAIKPSFTLTSVNAAHVAELCRRLDGLPLAIELAAARGKLLSPQALLERLSQRLNMLTGGAHDLPQRQRTLRDTIDWSYQLLSADEQIFWRRLSVFAGGFTRDAAEHVAGYELRPAAADVMQSLLDKCLIHRMESQPDGPRFYLLETLLEYAFERLEGSGEAGKVRACHAAYFAAFAESIEATADEVEQAVRFAQFDDERDNLQAALTEAQRGDDPPLQMRLVAALGDWLLRLHDPQGWSWLPAIFKHPETQQRTLIRAKALFNAAGPLVYFHTSYAQLYTLIEESAAIFQDLGETLWYARALSDLGSLAWSYADFPLAQRYCERSEKLFSEAKDSSQAADALMWRAYALRDQGHFARATELFEHSLDSFRQLNNLLGQGDVLNGMGDLAFNQGDWGTAAARFDEAARVWGDAEIEVQIADFALRGKGRVAYAEGDAVRAEPLLQTCVNAARLSGHEFILSFTLHHLGFVKHMLGHTEPAMTLLREATSLQCHREKRMYVVETLERFAWIAADTHQPERAARLFGAAEALRKWIGAPLPLGDKPLYDRYLDMTRVALNGDEFSQAWAEGTAMTLDQAVAYALADER
jgi:predicted ATPase